MYTEDEIASISSGLDEAQQDGLFRTVKACILGARSGSLQIVSVAVHPGFESLTRPIDLYVERYLCPNTTSIPPALRNLNGGGHCIKRYPSCAPRPQRYTWSVFRASTKGRGQSDHPRNELYSLIKARAGEGVRTVWGNILVVKADKEGKVCDVIREDIYFVETLVYSFIEDQRLYDKPKGINPLVSPDSFGSGWGSLWE